jgi:hypothetical protein
VLKLYEPDLVAALGNACVRLLDSKHAACLTEPACCPARPLASRCASV